MSTSFRLRRDSETGQHVTVSVFAGPDDDHRALCGQLTLRLEEADDLADRLLADEDDEL